MSKKALIILADGFEEIEAITPIDLLRRAGIDVTIAGLNKTTVTGAHAVSLDTDTILSEAGEEYDALILPGGMPGASNLANSAAVNTLITQLNNESKIIAAICASPAVVLAPTGILNGKSATCFPGMEEEFGGDIAFKKEAVVVDGNIITSRGAGTAAAFSLAIIEKLCDAQTAQTIGKKTLFIS